MKEAMEDDNFDPRRKSATDGRFKKDRRGAFVPQNPLLTALYLCHANFKRWKAESFATKPFVPENKGKSVILDKKWASDIFYAKRMYVDTQMAVWISTLSTRKHDVEGKTACKAILV
jgi:hypothetical protein